MKYLFLFILFIGCKNAGDEMVLSAESGNNYTFDKPVQVYVMPVELKGDDIEGLCADAANNRLLLASKHKGKIYAYEPGTGALKELWKIDEKKFAPSALAIHPFTNEIYVISSVGKQLLVLSVDGKIKETHQLTGKQFKQPEGMAFAANGDLYISNEGRGGDGNILLFRYQKK